MATKTLEEIKTIEERYQRLGFPGCIDTVDCAGWKWEIAHLVGRETAHVRKKPGFRMMVVCDEKR